jgi:hypothetical protein
VLTLNSIGNAKIAGMADDLELDSSEYSIALVVFFSEFSSDLLNPLHGIF